MNRKVIIQFATKEGLIALLERELKNISVTAAEIFFSNIKCALILSAVLKMFKIKKCQVVVISGLFFISTVVIK